MLLIDGAKYQEWIPTSEDEFERIFADHASEIFSEDSRYFDLKHKLSSKSGTGSIPDGYVITFGDKPQVHIVELELASHSLQHIVSQVVNIVSGIENPATQQKICNRIEDEINQDDILTIKITKSIKPVAIHRFLSDCFSNRPTINVVIDKSSPALEEALNRINYPHETLEFQTFTREETGLAVHAHLFEPLYKPSPPQSKPEKGTPSGDKLEIELDIANCIRYHYIPLYSDYDVSFFPNPKIPFIFETNLGDINTNVAGGGITKSISYIQRNLKKWFEAHPQLRKGDKLLITVVEPMNKYRLEIM